MEVLSSSTLESLLTAVDGAKPGTKFQVKCGHNATETKENMTLAGLVQLREEGDTIVGELPSFTEGHSVTVIDDDALVDEDELLARDGLGTKKCPPKSADEIAAAASAGRKPCKDCSCGLADVYGNDGEVKTKPAAKSSCGNCSLGDAFRCAGCPYLGLPPFKPGEKISISNSLMTSDI